MATKRITATLVERIRPPTEGRLEIYDDLLSGFCLRVTQRGRKSWSVVYRSVDNVNRIGEKVALVFFA